MKEVILKNTPTDKVLLSDFTYNNQFMGIEYDGKKFVLIPNCHGCVSFNRLDGKEFFGSYPTVKELLVMLLNNHAVKIIIFNDAIEMANWILTK